MIFYDANCTIGRPMNGGMSSFPHASDLLREMDRAGVEKALVCHSSAREVGAAASNALLDGELSGHEDRLTGCWNYLPRCCHELPSMPELFGLMKAHNIRAFQMFPQKNRFIVHPAAVGEDFAELATRNIPMFLGETNWESYYRIIDQFPDNIFIIKNLGLWGSDRYFRPLLDRYPKVYVELSTYWVAGGLADLYRHGYADRLLYGSGAPVTVHGSLMLAIRHAEIPEEAKTAIAGGTLERLLNAVNLEVVK